MFKAKVALLLLVPLLVVLLLPELLLVHLDLELLLVGNGEHPVLMFNIRIAQRLIID